MPKTLFICHANVGRSQMAEAYYNHLTKSKESFSAGVRKEAVRKYPILPQEILDLMFEDGVIVTDQRPKAITEDMVNQSSRIYVLCKKELCPDFLLNSGKVTFWVVEDPYRMTLDEMRKVRDLIKSKVQNII